QDVRRDVALRVGGLLVEDRLHLLAVLGLDDHPCTRSVHRSPFVRQAQSLRRKHRRRHPPRPAPSTIAGAWKSAGSTSRATDACASAPATSRARRTTRPRSSSTTAWP